MLLLTVKMIYLVLLIICSVAVPSNGQEEHGDHHSICDKKVDLGFIIDSSGSVKYHFKRQLELVRFIHGELSRRIEKLRVGVMTFSDDVIYYRRLVSYRKSYFDFYLGRMVFQGKITRIDRALDHVLKEFFLVHQGHRPGATKVAIMLTDGQQTRTGVQEVGDLSETARHIREDGVHLIVIGIVNVNNEVLQQIDAGMNHILYAGTLQKDNDGIVDTIPYKCKKLICEIEYEVATPSCIHHTDIAFVVDSSGSLRGFFEAEKYFVNSIAEQFDITNFHSRASFVRFSHIVKTEIGFTDYKDMHVFQDAVDGIFYDGGLTRIDRGLKNAEELFIAPSNIDRLISKNVKKVLVLLTDGRQLDTDPNPAIIAKRLREVGVEIVVLGISDSVDRAQMQEIAGPGVPWYEQKTFDDLINIHNIDRIKAVTCLGHEKVHIGHGKEHK